MMGDEDEEYVLSSPFAPKFEPKMKEKSCGKKTISKFSLSSWKDTSELNFL